MVVRFRVRHPNGVETLSVEDHCTIGALKALITTKTSISNFKLQTVSPPVRSIDLSKSDSLVTEHNLRGEALTLIPAETASVPAPSESKEPKVPIRAKPVAVDDTSVEWPETDSYVVLRVMADDNSCMFTAFGGVFGIVDPADRLRQEVAEYVLAHPETYNKVVLEKEPEVYATKIQDPQAWGGAIELGILSELYNIQISVLDVKHGRFVNYGEGYSERCILVYSGIHYDRIAQTFDLGLPAESDVTKWPVDDERVLEKTKELGTKLKKANYYTDMNQIAVRCEMPGCEDWLGSGEADVVKHMTATGHTAFSQIDDK